LGVKLFAAAAAAAAAQTRSVLVAFTSPHEAAMAARRMHGTVMDSQRLHMTWWDH
jgi:hypothetical protein